MKSNELTRQLQTWTSEFGEKYTNRNPMTIEDMDKELGEYCGCGKKSDLFFEFLPPKLIASGKVLEVGSNIGMQLKILQKVNLGLELFGLEPMNYAVEKGRELFPDITFVQGTSFEIPFEDDYFDIVMTNTVLIHIHPNDLPKALSEIHRVCKGYIHFHEYFSATATEVKYHGNTDLLWKTNFTKLYLEQYPDLHCVKERFLHYQDPVNNVPLIDQVGLLAKHIK